MDTTESEKDVPQTEIKIDRRKTAPWRTITLEDGTTKYSSKPTDPEYFSKYWHNKRKESESLKITCDRCQRQFTAGHTTRHQKSNYCIKRYNEQIISLLS